MAESQEKGPGAKASGPSNTATAAVKTAGPQPSTVRKALQPGKKIRIRSLPRKTWSGFQRFPKCQEAISARKDRSGYVTGLTPEMERELEEELKLPTGTLHYNSEFWKTHVFRMSNKDTVLDLGVAIDVVNYHLARKDPRIAESVLRLKETPKAEYVIYDIVEDAREENRTIELEVQAAAIFAKLSQADQVDFLTLMGIKAQATSPEVVKNTLYKEMKKDPEGFLQIANLPDRETRLLINNLLKKNILRLQGGHYMHGTVDIGFDMDAAVHYLNDPLNQDLRINLMQQLEGAKIMR